MKKTVVALNAGAWAGGTADKNGVKAEKAAADAIVVLAERAGRLLQEMTEPDPQKTAVRSCTGGSSPASSITRSRPRWSRPASPSSTDIGLPVALLDPHASVDSIVQRHPELAAEFDGLMIPEPGPDGTRDRAAEVRRAALVSKVLLNVFGTGSGPVTAGQLAAGSPTPAGWSGARLPARRAARRPAGAAVRSGGPERRPRRTRPTSAS